MNVLWYGCMVRSGATENVGIPSKQSLRDSRRTLRSVLRTLRMVWRRGHGGTSGSCSGFGVPVPSGGGVPNSCNSAVTPDGRAMHVETKADGPT
jgi:hypothetical protein